MQLTRDQWAERASELYHAALQGADIAVALDSLPDEFSDSVRQLLTASGISTTARHDSTPSFDEGLDNEPADAPDGERIGPYRLIRELGRGGQAIVFLAEDARLERPVALKLVPELKRLTGRGLLRIRREARAASRLDHPGICKIYEFGEADGQPYIAMQYIDGASIAQRLSDAKRNRQKPEIDRCLAVIENAARALHAAHEMGVVHRDIKPGNIMVKADGTPVILDFGLARSTGEDDTITRTGDSAGTPAYMSPEQLSNDDTLDRRTDVFSLGCTLFEWLLLERPFAATTKDAHARAVLDGSPKRPRTLDRSIGRDLETVLLTAIARRREDRYQTAEAFADELRRVRTREPIAARPIGVAGRTWRYCRRYPGRAALFSALVLGAVSLTIMAVYIITHQPAIEQHRQAEREARLERQLELGYGLLINLAGKSAEEYFDRALEVDPNAVEAIAGKVLSLLGKGKPDDAETFLEEHGVDVNAPDLRDVITHIRDCQQDRVTAALSRPEGSTALGHFLHGFVLWQRWRARGDFNRVLRSARAFEDAIIAAPKDRFLYHTMFAQLAAILGDRAIADHAARLLTLRWPNSAESWYLAAFAKQHSGATDEALEAYQRAVKVDPQHGPSLGELGMMLAERGQLEKSIEMVERGLACISDEPDVNRCRMRFHAFLGRVMHWRNRPKESIRHLRLALDSDVASAAFARPALCLIEVGHADEALTFLRDNLEEYPEESASHQNLGEAYLSLGMLDDALACGYKALALMPHSPTAHEFLGRVLSNMRRHEEAEQMFKKAIAAHPRWDDPWLFLAGVYFQQQRYDDALHALESAARIRPRDLSIRNNLGSTLCRLGRPAEAVEHFEIAAEVGYYLPRYHLNLGRVLESLNRLEAAADAVQKSIDVDPTGWKGYLALGRIRGKLGEPEAKRNAYLKLLTLYQKAPRDSLQRDLLARWDDEIAAIERTFLREAVSHARRVSETDDPDAQARLRDQTYRRLQVLFSAWTLALDRDDHLREGGAGALRNVVRGSITHRALRPLWSADARGALSKDERRQWDEIARLTTILASALDEE